MYPYQKYQYWITILILLILLFGIWYAARNDKSHTHNRPTMPQNETLREYAIRTGKRRN